LGGRGFGHVELPETFPEKYFANSLSPTLDSAENKLLAQEHQQLAKIPCSARNRELVNGPANAMDLISQSPPSYRRQSFLHATLLRPQAVKMTCGGALNYNIKYTAYG
jgi:hypothetical protein